MLSKTPEKIIPKNTQPSIILVGDNKNNHNNILLNLRIARSICYTIIVVDYLINNVESIGKIKKAIKTTSAICKKLLEEKEKDNSKGE